MDKVGQWSLREVRRGEESDESEERHKGISDGCLCVVFLAQLRRYGDKGCERAGLCILSHSRPLRANRVMVIQEYINELLFGRKGYAYGEK